MCSILEAMMREGASQIEVMAEIDVCEDTFYRWKKENEEFSESVARGKFTLSSLVGEDGTGKSREHQVQLSRLVYEHEE